MDSGCFKYNLDSVEKRIIPGKYNFVAQVVEYLFVLAFSVFQESRELFHCFY